MLEKIRMTEKAVKALPGKHLAIGNEDAHFLLINHEPIAYTCGVYGWNFDVYKISTAAGNVIISTGYRRTIGERVKYTLVNKYESRARDIFHDYYIPYGRKHQLCEVLLKEFIKAAAGSEYEF